MRFSLILENENGDQIDMTTTANRYMTSKIDGLYPPAGTISTSTYAGMDGSYLNNAFIEKRNIVISFEMRGIAIENNRHALYRCCPKSIEIRKIPVPEKNIDKRSNDSFMDRFIFRKTDRSPCKTFDPCS